MGTTENIDAQYVHLENGADSTEARTVARRRIQPRHFALACVGAAFLVAATALTGWLAGHHGVEMHSGDGSIKLVSPEVFGVDGGGPCKTADDCTNHGDCVNGACKCQGGFTGAQCETALACTSRADCSDHGDCINGACQCEPGYEGGHCETQGGCTLKCTHGGKPDDECSKCVDCAVGWSGDLCDTWDGTVDPAAITAVFTACADEQRKEIEEQAKLKPLPGTVGAGVDITSRSLKLPVVQLTYTDETKTWTNSKGETYREPTEAIFRDFQSSGLFNPENSAAPFRSLKEYLQHLSVMASQHAGVSGFYSVDQTIEQIQDGFFKTRNGLAVSQQQYAIYELELPVDPQTKKRQYTMHPLLQRAVNSLPPDYTDENNKKIYREFINLWGTSYTTTSTNGGMVEILTGFNTNLYLLPLGPGGAPFTGEQITTEAVNDMLTQLGQGSPQPVSQQYVAERAIMKKEAFGGDVGTLENLEAWKATIETNPVPVRYVISDISELIEDMTIKTNVQNAIQAYVKETMAGWYNINMCPDCARGQCTAPNEYCNCPGPTVLGKTCDVCTPGYEGANCEVPICNPPCQWGQCVDNGGVHSCACNNKHIVGPQCSQCDQGFVGDQCNTPDCAGVPNCDPMMRGFHCLCPGVCSNCSGGDCEKSKQLYPAECGRM